MSNGSRQSWAGLVALLFAAAGPVLGQDQAPSSKGDASSLPPLRVRSEEKSFPNADREPVGHPELLPNSLPEQPGCDSEGNHQEGGIFGGADFLYLRARRQALDFAIVDPNRNGVPEGSIETLSWRSDSGLHFDLGYRLPGSGWELTTGLTYFRAGADRTLGSPPGGTLFATLTHPGMIEQVDAAVATSNLEYYVLDADLGHRVRVGDNSCYRFFAGGRFAWIDQNLSAVYNGGDANQATVNSPISFNGAGLRAGGEGQWGCGWGLSVFGRASASLLVGHFRSHLTETNDNGTTVNTDVSDKFEQMVPVLELALGLAWQYERFSVSVGYEMSEWFNMVESPDFVDDVHQGKLSYRKSDLSLEGLFFQVGVGY